MAEDAARRAQALSSAEADLSRKQEEIGVLETETARRASELTALKDELEALRIRNGALDREFARKVDEIQSLKAHLEASEAQIVSLTEDAIRDARALSSAGADISTLKDSNAALELEVVRKEEHVHAIRQEMSNALSQLEAELETRDRRIATVEASLSSKNNEVKCLQAELHANEQQIEVLQAKNRATSARAAAVSLGQIRSRDEQIAMLRVELQTQREQTRRDIANIESRFLEERANYDEALERSTATIHAQNNTIAALHEELVAHDSAGKQLATEIIELRQNIENWQELTKQREQQLACAQEGLAAFEASTSWRLTSPLRTAVLGARSLARSFAGLTNIVSGQPLSPASAAPAETPPLAASELPNIVDPKVQARETRRERFKRFMSGSRRIALRNSRSPLISVIVVTHNSPELVFGCLSALVQSLSLPAQTIIFDNASDQETVDLLNRVDGAVITLHDENLHFLRAVNLAALPAKGRYLLILNSDAEVAPGAVEAAIETLEQIPDAGAVGARIILPDGTLQEAGCVIWKDGSCAGYGRGGDPEAREFNWRRAVDFCSGVFLVIPRKLFASLGGFDETFAPAYYEEVDLAVRIREIGKRIIYDPRAVVFHYEYGSSDSSRATDLMKRNQNLFRERHEVFLGGQHAPDLANLLSARSTTPRAKRLLYIEDDVPVGTAGSGMPRTKEIVLRLSQLAYEITFVALQNWARAMRGVYEFLPLDVELADLSNRSLEDFLASRQGYFGRVFVSRPHNMAALAEVRERRPELFKDVELIYDAEAIFARREMLKLSIPGVAKSTIDPNELLRSELGFARCADRVITVSPIEREEFLRGGVTKVDVLAHAVDISPTETPFRFRQDILFVGRLEEDDSPNVDLVVWFVNKVMPLIDAAMDSAPRVFLVGRARAPRIRALESARVILLGEIEDIQPWYDSCRIFVAPTRFAAGIPLKVCEAAAAGIPVVATDLVFEQLSWKGKRPFRSGSTAEHFAKACVQVYTNESLWNSIRKSELKLVEKAFSRLVFNQQLGAIFARSPVETNPELDDSALPSDCVD